MVLRIGAMSLDGRPRVVAAGGERELGALVDAAGADVVEVRADLFERPTAPGLVHALERVRAGQRPILLTVRSEAEGGRPHAESERRALYEAGLPHVDAIDIEIASAELALALRPGTRAAGVLLVLSAHDFAATPDAGALAAIVARGRALGADLIKLATTTSSLADVRTLLEVTLAARAQGIVTVGMGRYATLTRLALPAAGSLLTYGSVGTPTAPGQLPVRELRTLIDRLYP